MIFSSNGNSITHAWWWSWEPDRNRITNVIQILVNDFAILTNESDDIFWEWGIKISENSVNLSFNIFSCFSSVDKFGHAQGLWIIKTKSLQSVPKDWQVDSLSMHSIAHDNSSSSECNGEMCRLLFFASSN